MFFRIFLFLNIFLLSLSIFLYQKVRGFKKKQEETEMILEIRTKARTRAMEELAGNLEKEVEQRTEDLQEKIKELEKSQKMTVDRELKMIELKQEIKGLKEELAQKKRQKRK